MSESRQVSPSGRITIPRVRYSSHDMQHARTFFFSSAMSPRPKLLGLLGLLCCPASGLLAAPARPELRATRCGAARLQGETDIAKDDRARSAFPSS